MYGRTYELQAAISAVKAYICINKKKPQNLKFWDYMNPKANRLSAANKKARLTRCVALEIFSFVVQFP